MGWHWIRGGKVMSTDNAALSLPFAGSTSQDNQQKNNSFTVSPTYTDHWNWGRHSQDTRCKSKMKRSQWAFCFILNLFHHRGKNMITGAIGTSFTVNRQWGQNIHIYVFPKYTYICLSNPDIFFTHFIHILYTDWSGYFYILKTILLRHTSCSSICILAGLDQNLHTFTHQA